MALTTFSGLKTSIADWLNRSDLTNQIADFIALTEADFNAKLRIRQMEQIDAITIDSETETVPTGFIALPPPGPAIPLVAIEKFAPDSLAALLAISITTSSHTAPLLFNKTEEIPKSRIFE